MWAAPSLRRPAVPPHPTNVHSRLKAAKIRLLRMGNPAILLKQVDIEVFLARASIKGFCA
jgi:hypothetical protein